MELFVGGSASIGKGPHHRKLSAVAINECPVPSNYNGLTDTVPFHILPKLRDREAPIIVIQHQIEHFVVVWEDVTGSVAGISPAVQNHVYSGVFLPSL